MERIVPRRAQGLELAGSPEPAEWVETASSMPWRAVEGMTDELRKRGVRIGTKTRTFCRGGCVKSTTHANHVFLSTLDIVVADRESVWEKTINLAE